MTTQEFMELFFKDNETIYSRVIKDGQAKNISGTIEESLKNWRKHNELNYDVYFVVNSGGHRGKDIKGYNAVYIDLDAGRDAEGNYLSLNETEKYKQEQLKKIGQFKFKPSIIVETRNGLHVYWLLKPGATKSQFITCQEALIKHFNSDPKIKDVNRIMRVPGFYWRKAKQDVPFMCEVIVCDEAISYDIAVILEKLGVQAKGYTEEVKTIKSFSGFAFNKNDNIEMIKDSRSPGNASAMQEVFNPNGKEIVAENRAELYEIIYGLDIADFLGVSNPKSFKCFFHNDRNPSASIFQNPKTGHYLYKCWSDGCYFRAGNILTIVEWLHPDFTKGEAIDFIKNAYGIEELYTEWQKKAQRILEDNKQYLYSNYMREEYPDLYKATCRYSSQLLVMMDIAKEAITARPISDEKTIFFTSINWINNRLINWFDRSEGTTSKSICKRNNLFALLNLLTKIDPEDIPEKYLKESLKMKAMGRYKRIINYFAIPAYNKQQLEIGNLAARYFKNNNGTMMGLSREFVLRTYGEEKADEVFPQMKDEEKSKKLDAFGEEAKAIISSHIEKQGYAIESNILREIKGNYNTNKRKLKKCINEVLEDLDCKKVRCNKELKDKYNDMPEVPENSYPSVIIK